MCHTGDEERLSLESEGYRFLDRCGPTNLGSSCTEPNLGSCCTELTMELLLGLLQCCWSCYSAGGFKAGSSHCSSGPGLGSSSLGCQLRMLLRQF